MLGAAHVDHGRDHSCKYRATGYSPGLAASDQVAVRATDLPEGVALRMMRRIASKDDCLACHGSDVAPQVRDAIAARYPGDGATGFAVGDLRGALWVEVPATDAPLLSP